MTRLRDELKDVYGVNVPIGSTDATVGGNVTHTGDLIRTGNTEFTGDFNMNGGFITGVTVVNSPTYTLQESDVLLHVVYSGVCTITLPTSQNTLGRSIEIKSANDASLYPISIQTEGSGTIDGETELVINAKYATRSLYGDGSNWWIQKSYNPHNNPRLLSYTTEAYDTTIATADVFQPVEATFTRPIMHGFSSVDGTLTYNLAETREFEIDWSLTASVDRNTATCHFGLSVNDEVITLADPSVMGRFFKTLDEAGSISGTTIKTLEQGDTICVYCTSDDTDTITLTHFNATVRAFTI